MRVQLVDPSADVTPYDHALARGLARAGAEVELVTSRFVHGPRPPVDGFTVSESFHRRATRGDRSRTARRALRAAEHGPDMLRYRSHASKADVRHFTWLPLEPFDALLLPSRRPRVLTVHNTLRRDEGAARKTLTRLLAARMDALVVHAHAGARELTERFGADPARVHVIPHGAFDYLTHLPHEEELPSDLRAVDTPVILFFGLIRPYKGLDVLIEAFRDLEGAELWVVGKPMIDTAALRAAAARAKGTVRFIDRFVTDPEIPAFFRRADVVVLPYRQIDQSGVLYAALAFGKALVLSDVGGFGELGRNHDAARLVPPEDPAALRTTLEDLLGDRDGRDALGGKALAAAQGPYSWDRIARRTLDLYEELVG